MLTVFCFSVPIDLPKQDECLNYYDAQLEFLFKMRLNSLSRLEYPPLFSPRSYPTHPSVHPLAYFLGCLSHICDTLISNSASFHNLKFIILTSCSIFV